MKQNKKDDKKLKFPVKQRVASLSEPINYEIVSDEMGNLTKERAYQFLELKTFEGERAVREQHVQFLFDEFIAGRFLWHHVLIASAMVKGEEYRINGQHTCWMRVNIEDSKAKENRPSNVRFVKYAVERNEDLRALYSAFDRNAPRTVGHVSRVMMMDTPAGRELPNHIISQCVAGFRIFFAEDWQSAAANPNELVAIINQSYAEVFNVVGHFVSRFRDDNKAFRRAAVTAAMLATFEKSVQASIQFWEPVCSGLQLNEKTDPRHQLRNWLFTHGHTATIKGMEKVNQETMFRVCINMWNRWRKGESVDVVRSPDKRIKPV